MDFILCQENSNIMLVYAVHWTLEPMLSSGCGRVKNSSKHTCFTVLCRNKHDALSALSYHFNNCFDHPDNLSIDDGMVHISRYKLDSRGFDVNYFICDDMKEPIIMSNVSKSLLRLSRYYSLR